MCYGIFYFLKCFFWYELRIAINKVKHLEAAGIALHDFMYVWLTSDTFFSFQPDLNLILFLTLIMIKESLDGLHGHMPSMSERKSNWLVFTCVFEFSEHLPSPLQNDSERTDGRYVTVNLLAACVKRLVKRINMVFSIKSDLHTDS